MDAWPEAALSYFGILTSTLKTMVEEPKCSVLLVPDLELGTNDCRGWVRQTLFDKLSLPAGRFYQFRLAMDNSLQAKGAFKVMDDVTAAHVRGRYRPSILRDQTVSPENGRSIWWNTIVLSCGTGSSRDLPAAGVRLQLHADRTCSQGRAAGRDLPAGGSRDPGAETGLERGRHDALVEKIGGKSFDPDDEQVEDEQRAIEALLLADSTGEISRHPYVHYQLDKMLAKWAFKTLTGGGFTMPAFALADDGYLLYHEGRLYAGANWLPLH